METTSAIATINSSYPIFAGNAAEVADVIRENLGGEPLSPFQLQRLAVPSGGGLFWTDEEGKPVQYVDGIIVHTHNARSYWKQGLDESGGGTPPDCFSPDAIMGHGDPGGPCSGCQFAQFGSEVRNGKPGPGQACKQVRQVYLLREGSFLPTVLIAPPGSLKSFQEYLISLSTKGVAYSQVVTRLSLVEGKSSQGIKFAIVKATALDKLTPEQAAAVRAYGAAFKSSLSAAA